jgi:hypothetical protein
MDMANLLACHVESHLRRFEAATSRSHQDVVFGLLLRYFRRSFEPWRTVRETFATFINTEWQGSFRYRRNSFTANQNLDGAYIPLSETTRRLGIGRKRTKKLISAGWLRHRRTSRHLRAPILILRVDIEIYSANEETYINCASAARLLGISRELARRFIEEKALIPHSQPDSASSPIFALSRSQVDRIRDDIRSHCRSASGSLRALISFRQVLRRCALDHVDSKAMIDAMRNGQLPGVITNEKDFKLNSLFFQADDVAEYLANYCTSCGAMFVSSAVASQLLEVSKHSVLWLARENYLASRLQLHGIFISMVSIGLFNERFIRFAALARTHSTTYRVIRAALLKAGVKPIGDQPNSRNLFLERSSVMNDEFALLVEHERGRLR